jgi:DNA-binding NarL/FixJ family response regulator
VRVVIAEDQVLLREGLGRLFEDGGHQVVASLGDAYGLLPAITEHDPDLVVLDIRMPPTFTDEGARAAMEIKATYPDLGVLVLSQHIETRWAASATCSKTASSKSASSSPPPNASPREDPRSTPGSSPASSRPEATTTRSHSSPTANATCSS